MDVKKIYFSQYKFKYTNILYSILIISLIWKIVTVTIPYSVNMSHENVVATNLFQNKLTSIISTVKKHENAPIIFYSYREMDYEALISTAIYLKYNEIKNSIMVKTNYGNKYTEDNALVSHISSLAKQFEGGDMKYFSPLDYNVKKCFAIEFNGVVKDGRCKNSGKIWRLLDYPY